MRAVYTWSSITLLVLAATAGDVLIAKAMQHVGDVAELRRQSGLAGVVRCVLATPVFWVGIFFMAIGYFSFLVGLSWADVSLVAPASASLTFVANAAAARVFLHENVDKRRWVAAGFVAAGVALLTR